MHSWNKKQEVNEMVEVVQYPQQVSLGAIMRKKTERN